MAARQTFVMMGERETLVVRPAKPLTSTKSFVPPVTPFDYGKRLRQEGYEVCYCTSHEMEAGWLQAQ